MVYIDISQIVAVLALFVMVAIHLFFWSIVGRDPKSTRAIIPIYEPPDDLSPQALRYVWRNGADELGLAAAMLELAVKDVIRIKRINRLGINTWRLSEGQSGPEGLSDAEIGVAKPLLGMGRKNDSNAWFEGRARRSQSNEGFGDAVQRQVQKPYFNSNLRYLHPGMAAGYALLAFAYGLDVGAWHGLYVAAGQWLLVVLAMSLIDRSKWSFRSIFANKRRGFGFLFLIFLSASVPSITIGVPWILWVTAWVTPFFVYANFEFMRLMRAPTEQGRKLMDDIEGFRHYLSVTEWANLQTYPDLENMPKPLFRLMPYVLAFEIKHPWTDAFANAVHAVFNDVLIDDWEWSEASSDEDEQADVEGALQETFPA